MLLSRSLAVLAPRARLTLSPSASSRACHAADVAAMLSCSEMAATVQTADRAMATGDAAALAAALREEGRRKMRENE